MVATRTPSVASEAMGQAEMEADMLVFEEEPKKATAAAAANEERKEIDAIRAQRKLEKKRKQALLLMPDLPKMPFQQVAPGFAKGQAAKEIGARHRLDWSQCVKMQLVDKDVAAFLTPAPGPPPPPSSASSSLPATIGENERTLSASAELPRKTASRRKAEAKKKETAGPNWFNMPRGDLSESNRRDLQALQIRGAMDPKQFYKKSDLGKTPPVFFQMGTVKEDATEYYSARLTKQQRKKTILEELLQDTDRRQYLKKKFLEVQQKAQAGGKKWYKKKQEKKTPVHKRAIR